MCQALYWAVALGVNMNKKQSFLLIDNLCSRERWTLRRVFKNYTRTLITEMIRTVEISAGSSHRGNRR